MCNFKEKYKSLKKKGKHGAMYVSTVVKIISCVVVGALVISGLAVVTNGAMNSASGKVDSLFAKSYNYEGSSNNGGAIVPGEGESNNGFNEGNGENQITNISYGAGLYDYDAGESGTYNNRVDYYSWDYLVENNFVDLDGTDRLLRFRLPVSSDEHHLSEFCVVLPENINYIGDGCFATDETCNYGDSSDNPGGHCGSCINDIIIPNDNVTFGECCICQETIFAYKGGAGIVDTGFSGGTDGSEYMDWANVERNGHKLNIFS